ncbi:hypothetical protein P4S63_17605 [Pseudoalteromonas sp. B193]
MARAPFVPPLPGIEETGYVTSRCRCGINLGELDEAPKKLVGTLVVSPLVVAN